MTALSYQVGLGSFGKKINVAVVGASGGIGTALVNQLNACPEVSSLFRLARSVQANRSADDWIPVDFDNEETIKTAANAVARAVGSLHLVIVTAGILHDGELLQPEKSWEAISAQAFERAFRINASGPALVAKHFLPLLSEKRKTAFAAISARVGSIEDNQLGGWYAYRASKAALNMLIKTLAIELARKRPQALCIGLHPGSVDTPLSKPFQRSVPKDGLFTPNYSATNLIKVLNQLTPADSGGLYAWDGSRIPA
tara:strand:+ start:9612 stop:10376 length:765 start_codon:yes stop_codon:yes gene_type:complete